MRHWLLTKTSILFSAKMRKIKSSLWLHRYTILNQPRALVICQCELCSGGGVVVSGECLLRLNMAFNTLPFKLIKGRGGFHNVLKTRVTRLDLQFQKIILNKVYGQSENKLTDELFLICI
jgi:hypothetical protein